jgi:Protein of unknown function (DUF2934)
MPGCYVKLVRRDARPHLGCIERIQFGVCAKGKTGRFMIEQFKNGDWHQRPKPLTDFYREDRHELVQRLAYQNWEKRGRPLGSPEIDWFAAEKAVRSYLLVSGIEVGPGEGLYC